MSAEEVLPSHRGWMGVGFWDVTPNVGLACSLTRCEGVVGDNGRFPISQWNLSACDTNETLRTQKKPTNRSSSGLIRYGSSVLILRQHEIIGQVRKLVAFGGRDYGTMCINSSHSFPLT